MSKLLNILLLLPSFAATPILACGAQTSATESVEQKKAIDAIAAAAKRRREKAKNVKPTHEAPQAPKDEEIKK
jgi:hypothetical protein